MNFKTSDRDVLIDFVAIPVLLLLLVLLGNVGFLSGHSFFTDEDSVWTHFIHTQNSHSYGWRPDQGIGKSAFFADPGSRHVWSLFSWWYKLFDGDYLAYNLSVILFFWAGSVALFFLLKTAFPRLGRLSLFFLSSLIAFSSLRYEFTHNINHAPMIIAASLIPLILYRYFKKPDKRHYFSYTLVLFFVLFAGSVQSLLQTLIFSMAIFFAYSHYYGWLTDLSRLRTEFRRYFLLNLISGIFMALLGSWIIYSILIESQLVDYVRDPDYSPDSFFILPNAFSILSSIMGYLQAGLFSPWVSMLGIRQALLHPGWSMVSPVMPLILLITLFYKSRNIWEFSGKYIVFGFLFYIELVKWVPGILGILQSTFNLYPPFKFHPFIQVFEVVLLAGLLDRFRDYEKINILPLFKIVRGLSILLFLVYGALFFSAFLLVWTPKLIESFMLRTWEFLATFITLKPTLTLVPLFISENVYLFNETIGITSILFYGTNTGIFFLLMRRQGLDFLRIRGGLVFAAVLLINNLLLVAAVFPLNSSPLVSDEYQTKNQNLSKVLKPTDRYVRVGVPHCREFSDYAQCVQKKFIHPEYGALRFKVGYRLPMLEFSSNKTHSSRETEDFVQAFLGIEGIKMKGILRYLSYEPPFTSSRLYDFSAVNYYMSKFPLPVTGHLEKVYSDKQFFLYKNTNAWPYYYFADSLESISNYESLYHAKQGVAYLWRDEKIQFTPRSLNRKNKLELIKFKPGDVMFEYESEEQEFLVMADAWHPNWRAQVDGAEIDVVKANGVFKGAVLPAGKHKVHFFFDNRLYFPGVWISFVAWIVFLGAWILKLNPKI